MPDFGDLTVEQVIRTTLYERDLTEDIIEESMRKVAREAGKTFYEKAAHHPPIYICALMLMLPKTNEEKVDK